MKQFKSLVKWLRNTRLVFILRCLIFGFNKTKQKDMENLEILSVQINSLKHERFFMTNEVDMESINEKISMLEEKRGGIKKNLSRYILRIVSEFGEKWIDDYYSKFSTKANNPINLSKPNLPLDLVNLKLEIESFLINKELIEISKITEMWFKRVK